MSLDVIRSKITNIPATDELITFLKEEKDDCKEILYTGFPIYSYQEGLITIDALLLSERKGFIAFIFSNETRLTSIIDEQESLYYCLLNNLTKYPTLRNGRELAFDLNVISIVPSQLEIYTDTETKISSIDRLHELLTSLSDFNISYFPALVESLQKLTDIKPQKKRSKVKCSGSKGDIIKNIEKEIANLDHWQNKATLEMVDGPQRIRGLAGSGKTIIIALKAAYLHAQNPDWEIVITYYSRSLYQQYFTLINHFVRDISGEDPDWEKLHLYHAWGSVTESGLYSEISRSINMTPVNYNNAQYKYGRREAFSGICQELEQILNAEKDYEPLYDLLLIDEAQDLPASFFRIAYHSVKPPKRIVWAYDELQNLTSSVMPSLEEMFGVDENEKPIVDLNSTSDEANKDIILPVCYRNPPWSLALAHSLGFGIYRNELVQHFETLSLWKEIGYKIDEGDLDYGSLVTLSRSPEATPSYFYELLDPREVIETNYFNNIDEQYNIIAQKIKKNITEDELDPDDILVIFPSVQAAKRQYQKFEQYLNKYEISSILVGVTGPRDIFRINGSVSCATIYRAKGNEAPMVYILNSDYCYQGVELIKLRNILFTAITRSRAWVSINGVGEDMKGLISEINKFIDNGYSLTYEIPDIIKMKELRVINRERSNNDRKKIEEAQNGVRTILTMIQNGDLEVSQIPELDSLINLIGDKETITFDNEES